MTNIREGLLLKSVNVPKASMALTELVKTVTLTPNGDHLMARSELATSLSGNTERAKMEW